MRKGKIARGSLKNGLTIATLLCWILPIVIITAMAGLLLGRYYDNTLRRTADAGAENAMRQVELRLSSALEDSKAVSYEGTVRQAYRQYQQDKSKSALYATVSDYLSQKFSRNALFSEVYISFLGDIDLHPYATAQGGSKYNVLRHYKEAILPEAEAIAEGKDSGIYFLSVDNELYMVRNLLDSSFKPYALLVMSFEESMLFQSLYSINGIRGLVVSLDGVEMQLKDAALSDDVRLRPTVEEYTTEIENHRLLFTAQTLEISLWHTVPLLRWLIVLLLALVVPLLIIIIFLFRRELNGPMEVLIDANVRVQRGERGYQIREEAPNTEFRELYRHFNSMSRELSNQFDRLYQEQQALQVARIKALQSQINPHFLNNTLEIINWEARLANDEHVCSMIEALSTMLGGAIGRDGRAQIRLSEELQYVDAYLYITKERLGERISIDRSIDESMLDEPIPRLMLQPLVENAVDHDLSLHGGKLSIRAFRRGHWRIFAVEHDGSFTPEGLSSIEQALAAKNPGEELPASGGSVGIRNVNLRLRLLYGEHCRFTITSPRPGRILAQIELPTGS